MGSCAPAVLAVVLVWSVAACSSSARDSVPVANAGSPNARASLPSAPSSTAVETSRAIASANLRAKPAVAAYLRFAAATNAAQRHPLPMSKAYPADADFSRYAFTPLRLQFQIYLANLANDGKRIGGVLPQPRVKVKSVNLEAKPVPTVTLLDCPTPSRVRLYDVRTGKDVTKPPPEGTVPEPYLLTVTMIRSHLAGQSGDHWGASEVHADTKRTCAP